MDPRFFWFVARSSGMVTFGLLTMSTVMGLLFSTRLGKSIFERPWLFELHKFVSLLGLAFLGLHMAVLLPDQWTHFRVMDLLVPGTSAYQPAAVALGVVAMYGSVAATVSFFLRRLLGHRAWRMVHYTTFATFFLALLHGLAVGTDSAEHWLQLVYAFSGLLVSILTVFRFLEAEMNAGRPPRAAKKNVEAVTRLERGQSRI